ncbi:DUF2993 family protein [Streptomyces sp. SLBN-118]|uniref:LmeA family phospholipid-binding protein n=1 Tax=Streptomyces sp. SLBN-118 TaxID=2768454 RepID=UPI00114F3452|nr:DUF2993 domain-containing protein [Streptomyces sp. SLBN-118]TQK50384.1 DUF2993 family protein [Streptomyces sp. SLBN-118]
MRRRTWIALAVAGVLVAVPVCGELLARSVLEGRIEAAAARALDGEVDIDLASRPALLQLGDRHLPFVELDGDHVRLGRVPDAEVHARLDDVRFAGGAPDGATVGSARATVVIPVSAVAQMAGDLGGMPVTEVRTDPGTDTLTLVVGRAGIGSLTLRPRIRDGRVEMTVASAAIMGRPAPDRMTDRIGDSLARRDEGRDYPLGLEATSLEVRADGIQVHLTAGSPSVLPPREGPQ